MHAVQGILDNHCPLLQADALDIASTTFKVMAIASAIFAIIMQNAWLLVGAAGALILAYIIQPLFIPPVVLPAPPPPPFQGRLSIEWNSSDLIMAGTALDLLDTILPPELREWEERTYFYVATRHGFALILGGIVGDFTHGCDPIGKVVDPMITAVGRRRISPALSASFDQYAQEIDGLPRLLALQGTWKAAAPKSNPISEDSLFADLHLAIPSPDAPVPPANPDSSERILQLLSGEVEHQEYPLFDLEVSTDSWAPVPQNPDLKGASFNHFEDASLVIWAHEPNEQAIGSAITEKETELERLTHCINVEEQLVESCAQYNVNNQNAFISRLPNAEEHPHSRHLIESIHRKHSKQKEMIDNEVEQIKSLAEVRLQALGQISIIAGDEEKARAKTLQRVVKLCTDFLKRPPNQRQSVTPTFPNTQRLPDQDIQDLISSISGKREREPINDEVNLIREHAEEYLISLRRRQEIVAKELQGFKGNTATPTSYKHPTIQIKQRYPMDQVAISHLRKKALLDILRLLKMRQHQRLFEPFDNSIAALPIVINNGKDLLIEQVQWVIDHPGSFNLTNMDRFRRDCTYYLEDASFSFWDKFEWLLNTFGKVNTSFESTQQHPFLVRTVAWYSEVKDLLMELLLQSGRMTVDLESKLSELDKLDHLLQEGQNGAPLYLIKRLASGGHFISAVSRSANIDPQASQDEVHIPIQQ